MSEFSTLRHLLRGYVNQDWPDEFPTIWDGVAAFKRDEPAIVDALRGEIDRLIAEERTEEALRRLLIDELGSGYWPPGDGKTFSGWLPELRERLA